MFAAMPSDCRADTGVQFTPVDICRGELSMSLSDKGTVPWCLLQGRGTHLSLSSEHHNHVLNHAEKNADCPSAVPFFSASPSSESN